jgi:hypothetical protein
LADEVVGHRSITQTSRRAVKLRARTVAGLS